MKIRHRSARAGRTSRAPRTRAVRPVRRTGRPSRSLTWLLALGFVLQLAASLGIWHLQVTLGGQTERLSGASGEQRPGAVLIVMPDRASRPPAQARWLTRGLALAGFPAASLPLSLSGADATKSLRKAMIGGLADLADQTGLHQDKLWLLAVDWPAAALLQLGDQTDLAGLILVRTEASSDLTALDRQAALAWPENKPVALIQLTSLGSTALPASRADYLTTLYEYLSGEDPVLFAPAQGSRLLAPASWLAVSGQTLLVRQPVLLASRSVLGPGLADTVGAALLGWTARDAADGSTLAAGRQALRTSLAGDWLVVILSLGSLLAWPLLLNWLLLRPVGQLPDHAGRGRSIRDGLLWLPAGLLAAGVTELTRLRIVAGEFYLSPDGSARFGIRWLQLFLLAVWGCYGWLQLIRTRRQDQYPDLAGGPEPLPFAEASLRPAAPAADQSAASAADQPAASATDVATALAERPSRRRALLWLVNAINLVLLLVWHQVVLPVNLAGLPVLAWILLFLNLPWLAVFAADGRAGWIRFGPWLIGLPVSLVLAGSGNLPVMLALGLWLTWLATLARCLNSLADVYPRPGHSPSRWPWLAAGLAGLVAFSGLLEILG